MKRLDHILHARLHTHTLPPPDGAEEEVMLRAALRDKLHDYVQQPPAGVWEGIEQALLPVIAVRPARPLWLRAVQYAAAACVLVAAGLGGWRYFNAAPMADPEPVVATITPSTQPTEQVVASGGVQSLLQPSAADGYGLPVSARPKNAASAKPQMNVASIRIASRQIVADIPAIDPAEEVPYVERIAVDQPITLASSLDDRPLFLQDGHIASRTAWIPARSRRTPLSGSLYASDFALGQVVGGAQSAYSGATYLASRAADSPLKRATTAESMPLSHRAPLSLGLEVAFDLTDHVRLHTGVVYNYLHSDFERRGAPVDERIRQQLHYIGVPLAVSYDFYSTPVVDLYVRGGGTLEKGVYGVLKGPEGNDRLKMSGLQPSMVASVGIEMGLGRTMGIYLEPGVVYYPTLESQPTSYRTDHPVTFSLRAGVRINIGW